MGTVRYVAGGGARAGGRPPFGHLQLRATLYEMLAGRRAFQGESSAETMAAIVKEEPPDITEANPKIPPQDD